MTETIKGDILNKFLKIKWYILLLLPESNSKKTKLEVQLEAIENGEIRW